MIENTAIENKIILHIMRRPNKIKKAIQFLGNPVLTDENEITTMNSGRMDGVVFEETFQSVELKDEHAVLRWNTRVGPSFSKCELESLFNKLILMPYRFKKIKEGFGVLDSDIIFTYEVRGEKLIITTFYGRCSLNNSLYQLKTLRNYNMANNEKIALDLDPGAISSQVPPTTPEVYIEFSGVKTRYTLESYKVEGKPLPIFIIYCDPGKTVVLDINQKLDVKVNKNIIMMLFFMHYRDFVWEYVQEHYKEKVDELMIKFTSNP
ncbi:hypothetical protein QTG56_22890 (plasmid) [Rossellomorea sp. AcN35-11]|nr:hypothetical protein [Rossellomorea aquimaris]WJV32215.1 hypothetical protein QTG56_22890 [Rossellomorea sp. AcN35-11]